MRPISSNYENVLNEALNAFLVPELTSRDYIFEGVSNISTRAIPDWYEGIFLNRSANRKLSIRYCPSGPNTKELLTCSISLIKYQFDEFDYTSTNQMSVPCKDISTLEGKLGEKYAQIFSEIRNSLVESFEDVLSGNLFVTEHIDWQSLK